MFDPVGIRLEIRRCPIVDCARGSLRLQVKGIVAREANFDQALAALHGIEAGANKIPVKKNISCRREEADVGQGGLQNLCAAADGLEIQFASALRAHERAFRSADNDVAGDFLQVNITGDALSVMSPMTCST